MDSSPTTEFRPWRILAGDAPGLRKDKDGACYWIGPAFVPVVLDYLQEDGIIIRQTSREKYSIQGAKFDKLIRKSETSSFLKSYIKGKGINVESTQIRFWDPIVAEVAATHGMQHAQTIDSVGTWVRARIRPCADKTVRVSTAALWDEFHSKGWVGSKAIVRRAFETDLANHMKRLFPEVRKGRATWAYQKITFYEGIELIDPKPVMIDKPGEDPLPMPGPAEIQHPFFT